VSVGSIVDRNDSQMELADATDSRWVVGFNEVAEKIIGMSARELGELKENDRDAYSRKLDEASFKTLTFDLKTRTEIFQVIDTART
jgi:replication factor A1